MIRQPHTTHRLTVYAYLRSFGWTVREALAVCYRSGGARITFYSADRIVDPVPETTVGS